MLGSVGQRVCSVGRGGPEGFTTRPEELSVGKSWPEVLKFRPEGFECWEVLAVEFSV